LRSACSPRWPMWARSCANTSAPTRNQHGHSAGPTPISNVGSLLTKSPGQLTRFVEFSVVFTFGEIHFGSLANCRNCSWMGGRERGGTRMPTRAQLYRPTGGSLQSTIQYRWHTENQRISPNYRSKCKGQVQNADSSRILNCKLLLVLVLRGDVRF